MDDSLPELGDLEREVMQLVWANGPVTAEAVRERLSRPLKESTVRTVLRRLEDKGYTTHTVDGRTYVYQAAEPRGGLRRRRCSASSTGSATVRSRRSGRHGGHARCSTSGSCARSPTRSPRRRQRRRGGKKMIWRFWRSRRCAPCSRRRRVDWLKSSSRAKSARAHDLLGHRAGGVLVDAASDALDHGDHHRATPCRCRCRTICGRPAALLLEPLQPSLPIGARHAAVAASRRRIRPPINWLALATVVYACVAGMLLLRLAVGIYLTWRLARAATPMR